MFFFFFFFFLQNISVCFGEMGKLSTWAQGVEASVDGVLGGFGNVNEVDIKGSEAFLQMIFSDRFPNARNNQHLVALGTFTFRSMLVWLLLFLWSGFNLLELLGSRWILVLFGSDFVESTFCKSSCWVLLLKIWFLIKQLSCSVYDKALHLVCIAII